MIEHPAEHTFLANHEAAQSLTDSKAIRPAHEFGLVATV
jgi:hypothetical protein